MSKKIILCVVLFHFYAIHLFGQGVSDFYNINTVRDIRIVFKEQNWDEILDSLFINFGEAARLEGSVSIDGRLLEGVGIRYKGYSSWDVDQVKSPFNVELDYKNPNQNYQGFTKLKLSNVIRDPSFIREALSYEIIRKYMPASQANFANVYVNDAYIGLYTNVEAVDKVFAGKRYGSEGNSFFKGSPAHLEYPYGENANLAYSHGTDSLDYTSYYKLESEFGWSDLLKLIYILNIDTANLPTILNIDRALWMHAFNYALVNLDSYIGYSQNYYMYKDDNGVFNPIIWDLNMSFGSFRNTDATTLNLTIPKIKQLNPLQILVSSTFSPRPLIKNLLSNSTCKRMFLAHIRTIMNENFKNNEYYLRGKQIQTLIDPYVQADTNKFYSYTNFIKNIDTTVGPTSNNYPGIKDLMLERIAYLDTFPGINGYPEIIEIKHQPETPERGQQTWFSIKVNNANNVLLGFRNNSKGVFQKIKMYDDGNHNDSLADDNIYGVGIIPGGNIVQYFLYTENDTAGIFSPERAEYEFYSFQTQIEKGDIVINEFTDDWIELFNNTNESIDLNGLFLSDDDVFLSKWIFPDTSVAAKKYLVVRTNENVTSALHTNFSLNNWGGGIYFSDNGSRVLDSIAYGSKVDGKSMGRYPNGIGSFVYMQPTFSYCNNLGTTEELDFSLYPNPAKEKVYIEINNSGGPFSVEIINAAGKSVQFNEFELSKTSMPVISKSFDISALSNGVYMVKIISEEKILTKRFIII